MNFEKINKELLKHATEFKFCNVTIKYPETNPIHRPVHISLIHPKNKPRWIIIYGHDVWDKINNKFVSSECPVDVFIENCTFNNPYEPFELIKNGLIIEE